jgi:hypothetical protein
VGREDARSDMQKQRRIQVTIGSARLDRAEKLETGRMPVLRVTRCQPAEKDPRRIWVPPVLAKWVGFSSAVLN